MTGTELSLAISVFLACAVEAVEALTIVLAVGHTRSWRSAFAGVGAAIVVLAALTAALGPALTSLPINALRVVVGALLLIFGLQWLRKAILRAGGLKALHDEEEAYERELLAAREQGTVRQGIDPYSFTISFKGVLLEGLEVVFIVLTFGANQHNVGLAAAAAGVAVLAVTLLGFAIHAPLTRVPENALKFVVGVMLTSFGMFWGAEGAGAHWPGGDAALLAIIPLTLLAALAIVALLPAPVQDHAPASDGARVSRVVSILRAVWDFVVGDDWRVAAGVVVALGITAAIATTDVAAWWIMPVAVLTLLAGSVWRAARPHG